MSSEHAEALPDPAWERFRRALERALGIPLYQYKEPQMKRRLGALMQREGLHSWDAFARALVRPDLLERVRDTLTINVSEFFRQPDRFLELRDVHLPRLFAERPRLRIWSAGCSIGCEPYSIAILLLELDRNPRRHQLLATDVDFAALARAREGRRYLPNEVRSVPRAYLEKYFVAEPDGTYSVAEDVKRLVTFRHHDLLKDPYPTECDLIVCRNVIIYFTEEAKQHVFRGFAEALRPGGLLFIGGSEMIMRPRDLGLVPSAVNFYQRAA